jgi:hypothetical protein
MTANASSRTPSCRFCGTRLEHVFADLGVTPLANRNLRPNEVASEGKYPLIARVCHTCFLVQVDDSVPPIELFTDYDYFSSYSDSWVAHARRYCEDMRKRFAITPNSFVVEIASNDGYLLQHFHDVHMLGIEPAANIAKIAIANGIATEIAFFGVATAKQIAGQGRKADLIVANNVLAHAPQIKDFVGGVAELLASEGVATFEFPHLLRLIEGMQFDTIYHEHFFYLSLLTVERLMAFAGLRVFDVEQFPTHGGSLRLFVCHRAASHAETTRVDNVRLNERTNALDRISSYQDFYEHIEEIALEFRAYVASAHATGTTIAAYGAAAKGNTFLNTCNVAFPQISAVYDRNTAKQGKLTPGGHIPILAPDRVMELNPDDLVILPWNIADEIVSYVRSVTCWRGQFIVALPHVRVLSA